MSDKVYGFLFKGRELHKYQVYWKGLLQGWLIGESPEEICRIHQWDIGRCRFELEALSCSDLSSGVPIKAGGSND